MLSCCGCACRAGWLEAFQLAALADITQELASGHVLLNAQGGLDIPGVPVRAAAEILRQVEGIGLSARQTGGDCVQASGAAIDEGLVANDPGAPVYPLVCALEQALCTGATSPICRVAVRSFSAGGRTPEADPGGETDTVVLQEVSARITTLPFLLIVPGDMEGGFLCLPPDRRARHACGCWKHGPPMATARTGHSPRSGRVLPCARTRADRCPARKMRRGKPWQTQPGAGSGLLRRKCAPRLCDSRRTAVLSGSVDRLIEKTRSGKVAWDGVRLMNGCTCTQALDR